MIILNKWKETKKSKKKRDNIKIQNCIKISVPFVFFWYRIKGIEIKKSQIRILVLMITI